jgi:hypothetical protein
MLLNFIKLQKLKDVRKPFFTHTRCTVNDNNNPQCFAFFLFSLCFWIFVMIFFNFIFVDFIFLIWGWLRIWIHNLFLFILPFYKINMVCGFVRVTRVALVYKFGGVFFFSWTWLFYRLFFFHIVKKKFQKKVMLLNFMKFMNLFTSLSSWLGWRVWQV